MGIVKIALLTSAALCMGAVSTQVNAQQTSKTYNLPEQDLATALRSVARGSDYQLVADAKSLRGARAPSLAGAYTVEEAVAALLAPSGLTAEIQDRTITLRGRDAPSREAVTSATDVLLSVTGSRIRGAQPTSPVISASREKITELGHSDLGAFARSIPQNFSGGQNPGVISSVQTGSENVNSSSALNLRGLGPDATLTLLNGHRLAYDAASQGVDISAIPLAAIDRIEVVADGSSALYGSDAVGGVANIILRREYEGLLSSIRLGTATEGGNFQQQYSAVSGARWSSGGIMLAGDFSKATDITAGQRDLTDYMESGTTLLPSQRQISAILAGHQRMGNGAEFEIDAHYNHHRSRAALPFSATAPVTTGGNLTRPTVESYSVSPSVTFHLPADWDVSARATRAVSDTQIEGSIFSGGVKFADNLIRYKNDLWSAEISGDGPLVALPGGDVRLALGAGLRSNGLAASVRSVRDAGTFNLVNYLDSQTAIYGFGEVAFPKVITPRWAPDGKRLAFLKYVDGHLQLWSWDGSRSSEVAAFNDDIVDFRFTPDGSSVIAKLRDGRNADDALDQEGLSGYHYDDRWFPYGRNRPFPRGPAHYSYAALSFATGEHRPATPAETRVLTESIPPSERRAQVATIAADDNGVSRLALMNGAEQKLCLDSRCTNVEGPPEPARRLRQIELQAAARPVHRPSAARVSRRAAG